jgi:hypothetical protein
MSVFVTCIFAGRTRTCTNTRYIGYAQESASILGRNRLSLTAHLLHDMFMTLDNAIFILMALVAIIVLLACVPADAGRRDAAYRVLIALLKIVRRT